MNVPRDREGSVVDPVFAVPSKGSAGGEIFLCQDIQEGVLEVEPQVFSDCYVLTACFPLHLAPASKVPLSKSTKKKKESLANSIDK